MIEKALKYIVGLKEPKTLEIEGYTYSDKQLIRIEEPYFNDSFMVSGLDSIVEYVKKNVNDCNEGMRAIIHIRAHDVVSLKTECNADGNVENHVQAVATVPSFEFGRFHDTENFNIALQSKFMVIPQETGELVQMNDCAKATVPDDRGLLLMMVGNLKEEAVKNIGDDGVSQSVTIRSGIASVADVPVPNPVTLKPYRTFLEVDQPESKFVFRMRNGGECALFEADGGAWKMEARRNIKEYLASNLHEEIEAGEVVILS